MPQDQRYSNIVVIEAQRDADNMAFLARLERDNGEDYFAKYWQEMSAKVYALSRRFLGIKE